LHIADIPVGVSSDKSAYTWVIESVAEVDEAGTAKVTAQIVVLPSIPEWVVEPLK